MKKIIKIVALALPIFLSHPSGAQTIFEDAKTLSKHVENGFFILDTNRVKEYCNILNRYLKTPKPAINYNTIFNAFTMDASADYNPILASFFKPGSDNLFASNGSFGTSRGGILGSISNLNVTSFADGLAQFLVERAKEELNVAFFRKFQDFINRYPEIKTIFPNTYEFLSNIYSYEFAAYLPALRTSFYVDLNGFSKNLISLRELSTGDCPAEDVSCTNRINKLTEFLREDPLGRSAIGGLLVADNLMQGNNAAEIIQIIATDVAFAGKPDNFSNGIRFANLLSQSLRSEVEGEIWVDQQEVNILLANTNAVKLFLGLILAKNNKDGLQIKFLTSNDQSIPLQEVLVKATTVTNEFEAVKTNLKKTSQFISMLTNSANKISVSGNNDGQNELQFYLNYAESLADLLQQTVSFFGFQNSRLKADVKLFNAVVDLVTDACYDIKSHQYAALVMHTSILLDTVLKDFSFKHDFLKYGTFMANIVEADNATAVKQAIETAVLPAGSSSIKRETKSNISLNGYIGPSFGREFLPALESEKTRSVVGLSAPVGIALSWGNLKSSKEKSGNNSTVLDKMKKVKMKREIGGKSISVFVPLIDVGALATFRLNDDQSNVASEVKLGNIIAPGIFLYYGLGKSPLSIGGGVQIGPQLRKINEVNAELEKNFYLRYGVSLAVDIPFFNFYTNN